MQHHALLHKLAMASMLQDSCRSTLYHTLQQSIIRQQLGGKAERIAAGTNRAGMQHTRLCLPQLQERPTRAGEARDLSCDG